MKKINLFLAIVLSLGVIIYVVLSLEWSVIQQTFRSLNIYILIAAFAIYFFNYILRSIRFKVLLDLGDIPFIQLLGVTNLHGMYLYLMPAKIGEAAFPILLKRRLKIDITTSTGSLVVARLFDFFSIALILVLVLVNYWMIIPANLRVLSIIFCCLVLGFFSLFLIMVRSPDKVLPYLAQRSVSRPLIKRVLDFFAGVYQGTLNVEQNKKYTSLLILSLAIWFCVNFNFFLITISLGYSFNFFQIIIVTIIMVPVTLFPIQGFANIGAHEVGWIAAYTLFDYPYDAALSVAISSHIIYVLFVLLIGLLGIMLISKRVSWIGVSD